MEIKVYEVGEISERLWMQNQSWFYRRIVMRNGYKLRVDIKRNAYDVQSFARVKVWNRERLSWNWVCGCPITECDCKAISYVKKDPSMDIFRKDGEKLFNEALQIVSEYHKKDEV